MTKSIIDRTTGILYRIFKVNPGGYSYKVSYWLWAYIWDAFPKSGDKDTLMGFRYKPDKYKERFQQILEMKAKEQPGFLIDLKIILDSLSKADLIPRKQSLPNKKGGVTEESIKYSLDLKKLKQNLPAKDVGGGAAKKKAYKKIKRIGAPKKAPIKPIAKSKRISRGPTGIESVRSPSYSGSGPAAKKKWRKPKPAPKKKAAKKANGFSKAAVKRKVSPGIKSKLKTKEKKLSSDKAVCYTRATMDKQILLKKSVDLKVEVSREVLKKVHGMESAEGKGEVELAKKLTIQVQCILNMRVKGSKKEIIDVPEPGEPQSLIFTVLPTHIGKCKLTVDVWQEQVPVCSLELEPVCVASKNKAGKIRSKAITENVKPFPSDLIQLRIRERQEGRTCYYEYELDARSLNEFDNYTSPPIKVSREQYIKKLYKEIETLWDTVADDPRQFKEELQNFGGNLFDRLFPGSLQEVLYKHQNKILSIQVISSEPFIPWELVLIKNPTNGNAQQAGNKFLGELGLIRWMHGWVATDNLLVRKGSARYIIPHYVDPNYTLPAASVEEQYLIKNFSAKEISPDPVIISQVLRKPGTFDLLHFCCHGESDTSNISHAKLRMLEKNTRTGTSPAFLTQLSIEQCGKISKGSDHRPIVVLNACQTGRSGNSLSGYGGFANAFLRAGAGAFIGSHWSIEDAPAVTFITTFYAELLKGKNLAEATIEARKIASKAKDSTWISYVVYGHPFAVLKMK